MNQVFTEVLKWLSQPETIIAIITFTCTIPQYIDKFKKAKGHNVQEKSKNFFLEISKELVNENISKDEKRHELIKRVYNRLPEKERKYLSEENAQILANGIYHTFVKPEIEKDSTDKNLDNLANSEAT